VARGDASKTIEANLSILVVVDAASRVRCQTILVEQPTPAEQLWTGARQGCFPAIDLLLNSDLGQEGPSRCDLEVI